MAEECYQMAKDEGCDVEVVWQDGDSSAQKSVEKVLGGRANQSFYMWRSCRESIW